MTKTQTDERTGTLIGPRGLPSRYLIGWESGEVFAEDEDFDGYTITIAVSCIEEGVAIVEAIARVAELERERDEARARVAELEAAIDSEHAEVGYNIWRFWRDKARQTAESNTRLRARVAAVLEEAAGLCKVLERFPQLQAIGSTIHDDLADDIRALATDPERDALAERDARIRAEEQEKVRHMLGAMLMAVEEDCDVDDPDYSGWFRHWMTHGAPTDDPHLGDCTKFPMTCHRCLWDRAFAQVDKSLAAIRERED